MEKNYDIFISCKSEDYPIAERVYRFLTEHGKTVFLANLELKKVGNTRYFEIIDDAIDSSEHMIVVATRPEYVQSTYVKHEWTTFANEQNCGRKSGNLMSVIARDVPVDALPITLRNMQFFYVDAFERDILGFLSDDATDVATGSRGTTEVRTAHATSGRGWDFWARCLLIGLLVCQAAVFADALAGCVAPDVYQQQEGFAAGTWRAYAPIPFDHLFGFGKERVEAIRNLQDACQGTMLLSGISALVALIGLLTPPSKLKNVLVALAVLLFVGLCYMLG